MSIERDARLCPSCGEKGRRVSVLTLTSHLNDEAKTRLDSADGFSFCKAGDCDVSYFGSETFSTSDVRFSIFQKSGDPKRLVCYCFGHSVEEIEQEVSESGTSSVPSSIRESCKKGLDSCEKNNPQGSCCLGNVSRVVKSAQASAACKPSHEEESCCSTNEIES